MKTALIWLAVLLALFLIDQIRVGVSASYSADGPVIRLRFGAILKQVFPAKPKEKNREKKPKPEKEKKANEPKTDSRSLNEKLGGGLEYARELLPLVLEAAGQFQKKLQVDRLRLRLTVSAPDPADTAMRYGEAMSVLGTFWYPLTEAFHVKDGLADVNTDFELGRTVILADASLSLKIGQILWLSLYFGCRGLRAFLSVRSQQKKQTRKAA